MVSKLHVHEGEDGAAQDSSDADNGGRGQYWYPAVVGTPQVDVPLDAVKNWTGNYDQVQYAVQRHLVARALKLVVIDRGTREELETLYLAVPANYNDAPEFQFMKMCLGTFDDIDVVGIDEQGWVDQFDDYHSAEIAEVIRAHDSRVWPDETHVLCAANRFTLANGSTIIITGARHYSPNMSNVMRLFSKRKMFKTQVLGDDQGFITNHGVYITREEGLEMATRLGQLLVDRNGSRNELFSEGLY